jgi:hypothetical protein
VVDTSVARDLAEGLDFLSRERPLVFGLLSYIDLRIRTVISFSLARLDA